MPLIGGFAPGCSPTGRMMRRLRPPASVASMYLVVVALPTGPARAQTAATDQLGAVPPEIVVTATRSPINLNEVQASVNVITSSQLRDTPARGLDDILRQVPGTTLTMMGPDAHPLERAAPSVGVSGMAERGRGDPGDPLGIGDQHIGRRETSRNIAGPAGADYSGTVEQQFRLAAILRRAEQRQRGARFG